MTQISAGGRSGSSWRAGSLQDEPFVHIDTDVFLWKPLPPRLTSAPVFSQCPEDHPLDEWCGPQAIEAAFARHGLLLPIEWQWARAQPASSFREENCGILGGTRVDFLRHYAQTAIDVVMSPAHARLWREFPEKSGYNMIVEQFLLAALPRLPPTSTGFAVSRRLRP